MEQTHNLKNDRPYYLPLLLILSVLTHFPYVLKGFGEIDATKIAVAVIDILNHGADAAFANFYFTDVIPLYMLYLSWFMKLLNHDYSSLPIVMNYTNAVIGTLTIIPAFLLVRKLFGNATVAFCSVLALIFAPSFYQSTIMGFPHLIAFFFLLVSLCFYLSGLDSNRNSQAYLFILIACLFLTIAFLFKSDYVLASGIFFGFLLMRKISNKGKIIATVLMVFFSGIIFLLFRNMILGPSSGTTMSQDGISKWYDHSISIPRSLDYFIIQAEPIYYGAGIATFCLFLIAFVFFLYKRRSDILLFVISWTALPTFFWFVLIGNNARHNMITTLPFLVAIILFIYEKAPKYVYVFTTVLILSNFLLTSPSLSILRPSGNLFKSNTMLETRVGKFTSTAKQIVDIEEDKIVVLGYFHNPHVVFDLLRSSQSYKADKIGREDYRIQTRDKEYVFIYFVVSGPEEMGKEAGRILNQYQLHDHVFVSATYDLQPLAALGLKTKTVEIIKRSSL